jgi:hypothetical protein
MTLRNALYSAMVSSSQIDQSPGMNVVEHTITQQPQSMRNALYSAFVSSSQL